MEQARASAWEEEWVGEEGQDNGHARRAVDRVRPGAPCRPGRARRADRLKVPEVDEEHRRARLEAARLLHARGPGTRMSINASQYRPPSASSAHDGADYTSTTDRPTRARTRARRRATSASRLTAADAGCPMSTPTRHSAAKSSRGPPRGWGRAEHGQRHPTAASSTPSSESHAIYARGSGTPRGSCASRPTPPSRARPPRRGPPGSSPTGGPRRRRPRARTGPRASPPGVPPYERTGRTASTGTRSSSGSRASPGPPPCECGS